MTSGRIAIIGVAARFPGAPDARALWEVIRRGEVHLREVPEDRWDPATFFDPTDPRATEKAYSRRGGFLDEVRRFSALHFGLSPRRAQVMDPQHRLLVELARVALQDAGYERRPWARERTAVIVGASVSEFRDLLVSRLRAMQLRDGAFGARVESPEVREQLLTLAEAVVPSRAFTLPGSLVNLAAATVSQVFDLGGPSFTVDAACASSLVAVHQAIAQLRAGQCDVALAGGVYLNFSPDNFVGFSRIGALSRSGHCRPLDERADGFVVGEGAGLVVLKRLEAAQAEGDRIYAVIAGSGTSNDGRSEGPMTPRREGMVSALRRAYADAGVSPDSVGYVELHGAASSAADQLELSALREVRGERGGEAVVGSVKANFGHTLSAAGIAGLLKATLALHFKVLPPQAACETPDPALGLDGAGLSIARAAAPWGGVSRRAAVSAFGFGGTNAHLVLEEAPARPEASPPGALPFVVSAPTRALLSRHLRALAEVVAGDETLRPGDVAFTLHGRADFAARTAFVAEGRDDLLRRLDEAANDRGSQPPAPFADWVQGGERRGGPDLRGEWALLPATPLEAEEYWPLDASRIAPRIAPVPESSAAAARAPLQRGHAGPNAGGGEVSAARLDPRTEGSEAWPSLGGAGAPAAPENPEAAGAALGSRVRALIAQVGAFDPAVIRDDQRLGAELGFDSLMRGELEALLLSTWSGLDDFPEALRTADVRAGELVAFVRAHARGEKELIAAAPVFEARFADRPEVRALEKRLAGVEALGLRNPYFHVHERVAADTTVVGGQPLVNFSSYDYLGFSSHPAIAAAAKAAIDRFGTSVSASRVASGERPLHRELERAIAGLLGTEDCITFVSGHATNESVIGHLFGPGDLVVHDALAHDSILQGCRLSGARRVAFAHNDPEALDALLTSLRPRYRRALVAIEGVYSMDGDFPDLPRFIEVKRAHRAMLLVDEAHSLGVLGATGRGIGEHFGVTRSDVDLWMGTLSKAMASCGGYIAAERSVVQYLKYTAPAFVFSVGLSPPNAAAACAAIAQLIREPERAQTLRSRSRLFEGLARAAGLDTGKASGTGVIPVIVGDSLRALQASEGLRQRGVNAQPIVYPAVQEHLARLRFFVSALHSEEQVRIAVDAVRAELLGTG